MIGKWAFLIGFVLAVLLGAFSRTLTPYMVYALVVIGLVVGFLNVAGREVSQFLISGAVLVIVASLGQETISTVPIMGSVLQALLTLFVPATLIVAVKHAFSLAKN
ncbi:MAG: hypothetical protein AABX73_04165 [Nanoarchaeota archaeon]